MTYFYSGWVTPPLGAVKYRIRLSVSVTSQDIENNTSTLAWALRIEKDRSDLGFYDYPGASWHVYINGSTRLNGSGTKPDASWPGTATWSLGSGSYTVTHDDDGTMENMPVDADFTRSASGYAPSTLALSGTPTMDLPTIPRATEPTVSPTSGETGTTYTITHDPAASTFYHDIAYSLDDGGAYTDIATNVVGTDTTTDWTPAHTLLPDDTGVTAIIRVITRESSGGTIIGTETVNLPLTVPSSVKPTVSSVAWADDQTTAPDLPTLMGGAGRFVQRWSLLEPTVTAAGAGGSSIVGSEVIQNGQTTDSGVAFDLPIALSGSVPFSVVATDSRGRTNDAYADTVTVKAYNYPSLPTPSVVRTSDSGGTTPDPAGTYLKITPGASVSSLNFGDGEKNLLEWRVRTRPAGGSWTTDQDWTAATVSGNVWTTPYILGGFSASSEFEVEVSIRDLFGKNGYSTSQTVKTLSVNVPSESVFMDRVAEGLALGAYHTGSGAFLQVTGGIEGDAITQSGNDVIDTSNVATDTAAGIQENATDAETITGTATDRTVTPANLTAALEDAFGDYAEGYRYVDEITYNASGTFSKGSFPFIRAIRVRVVGGGAAGGASAVNGRGSGGGGAGAYAESFITDIASLSSSETITVGAGGTGVSGGDGNNGGSSSFGALVVAGGGLGGLSANAGLGGTATAGGLQLAGGDGGAGGANGTAGGSGGGSRYGGGGMGAYQSTTTNNNGEPGRVPGSGGGGAFRVGSSRTGGAGAAGQVIVELYA